MISSAAFVICDALDEDTFRMAASRTSERILIALFLLSFTVLARVSIAFSETTPGGGAVQHDESCEDEIRIFDVGEGESILLRSRSVCTLIDAGNPTSAYDLMGKLKNLCTSYERLVLTHPHKDHIGGSFLLSKALPFEKIHDNGESLLSGDSDVYRWYGESVRGDTRYSPLRGGDSFTVGSWTVKVIWPPLGEVMSADWNTNSLVLLVERRSWRALLMGDANDESERLLLTRGGLTGPIDLLKVGHHGSRRSSTSSFLEVTRPKRSVISVNRGNVRGYPDPATVERLRRYGSVTTTYESGDVVVTPCE